MKNSKLRIIAVFILLVGLVIQVLYDPISSARHALMVSNVRAELPEARAQWEASGITDYTFVIQGDARSICQPSAMIEVRNNSVVKVEAKDFTSDDSSAKILPSDQWADPDWGEEVFLCSYFHFTMPQVFDLVEVTLRNYPSSIMQTDFDPQYGFVSDLKFGIYVGYGLLRPEIGECCNELHIQNFKIIQP